MTSALNESVNQSGDQKKKNTIYEIINSLCIDVYIGYIKTQMADLLKAYLLTGP